MTRRYAATPAELWESVRDLELTPDDGGTMLVFDHARIQAERGMRYARSWTRGLETLA